MSGPPPAGGHERYWESFLRGSPSPLPPTHLLTGQQMERGGAQTTTSPTTISVCVCDWPAGWPRVCVWGQHGYRCRCDPSCLSLATLSVIPPKWTVQFAFAVHPGSANAANTANTQANSSAWPRREASDYKLSDKFGVYNPTACSLIHRHK